MLNRDDRSALAEARAWVRRSPGPEAWSNLGAVYATGTPPDLRRARQWYRRAALRAHGRGCFEYGLMLIQGEGGPRRPTLGRRFLEKAADQGDLDALKVLAHGLAQGAFSFPQSGSRAARAKRALRRALHREGK